MTLILMFDRGWSAADEIRFSLFKFKVGRAAAGLTSVCPHRVETGSMVCGRLLWKKFVGRRLPPGIRNLAQSLPVGSAPHCPDAPRSALEPVGSGQTRTG
jgi:hypothetical protein